jgi:cyanophycin synthetase
MTRTGLALHGRWVALPGAGFGVRQPTLSGLLAVTLPRPFDRDALVRAMSAIIGDVDPSGEADDVRALAECFALWYHALHDRLRVTVVAEHRVVGTSAATDGSTLVHLALPFMDAAGGRLALESLIAVVDALLKEPDADPAALRERIVLARDKLAQSAPQGINIAHLVRAAHALRIPAFMLRSELYQFGHGCHARLMRSTATDATSNLGTLISSNKAATALMLRRCGLPVPDHRMATSEIEARKAAAEFGFPVVVKPTDQEQGRGVFADLRSADAVAQAWREARGVSKSLIVEQHVSGDDVRVTVLEGEVLKIIRRRAGGVTGDGERTVARLVEAEADSEETRARLADKGFRPVALDEEALGMLRDRGLSSEAIVPAGEFLPLRRRGNVSAGGTQVVLGPGDVHPDNLSLALRAAAMLRLDLAGIDLILTDSRRSWLDAGGVILEVNAIPQVSIVGTPLVYQRILGRIVPQGGRIPLRLVVTGKDEDLGETQVRTLLDRHGAHTLSQRSGNSVAGCRATIAFRDGFSAARAALADPATQSLVAVMSAREVREWGLPFPEVDAFELQGIEADGPLAKLLAACIAPHAGTGEAGQRANR